MTIPDNKAYVLSEADQIWNRACSSPSRAHWRAGDRALHDLLHFHGLAMNGGVLAALEECSPRKVDAALRGYCYFGLDAVAATLRGLRVQWMKAARRDDDEELDDLEERADRAYNGQVESDEVLVNAFKAILARQPEAFARARRSAKARAAEERMAELAKQLPKFSIS